MTKKQVHLEEEVVEESEELVGLTLPLMMPKADLSPTEMLRLQLLIISKDISMGKASMRWETHKQYSEVTVAEIIEQAQNMFKFVSDSEECE